MDFEALQSVILDAARQRSLNGVLQTTVAGLAAQEVVALARIWLISPGDICEACHLRAECPDQRQCLHLVASDGASLDGKRLWARIDGAFRRFPLGVRKVGHIAATGKPSLIEETASEQKWLVDPEWASREQITAFAGQPLVFDDETIGVLGLFSRARLDARDASWLRMFADHAAAAIANIRAYEEIKRLRSQLQFENAYLREEVNDALAFGEIVGESPALKKTLQQVELVAPTDANVLIQGESGTGKELIARSIHERSRRRDRPMIKVNCASIPRDLFESEFFGHVKGAFTGAVKARVGRFQLADGGTIFLDEIGEIPLELQSKLLRILQEGEFERVGDDASSKVDVRVISATNKDLLRDVEAGRFRQDLYYRLSVFPIEVPPLRERPEDVQPLAIHFTRLSCRKFGMPPINLTRGNIGELAHYDWPGNVRELQHVIEREVIMSGGGSLKFSLTNRRDKKVPRDDGKVVPLADIKSRERESILAALEKTNGKVYGPGGAARLLGIKPTTLASKMKSLGIKRSL
jgi:transcriptional regulator with GAF, ATPase, and Fis domain